MIPTLPIHERFRTFQGEGVHMGRPAFFLRTFGCPIHCPWCDSAGTWHKDYVPKGINKMTVEEMRKESLQSPQVDFVVITGGEPTVHDLAPLVTDLQTSFMPVHLETSGAFPIGPAFDWVTLSPKKWKMPIRESVLKANEFKIIVEEPDDIEFYLRALEEVFGAEGVEVPIWLHPEWSQRRNPKVLDAICKAVVEQFRGAPFRAGWQLHKLFAVDLADTRSRPPVPLGGNPEKGY